MANFIANNKDKLLERDISVSFFSLSLSLSLDPFDLIK